MKDRETENPGGEAASGSLADAIAAHLALKREHGADPETVEHELEDALSPPEGPPLVEEPAEPEPEPVRQSEPEPEPQAAPAREPEPAREPDSEPQQQAAPAADQPAPEPAPAAQETHAPGEITGTIEFEFGGEEQPEEAAEQPPERDLLEDVPDFFEETPEHDRLWFDEAPPRKFDF